MDAVLNSVSGLGNFALYFGVSILLLFVFKVVYAFVTPHDEWALVKIHKNQAAAIGFGGAMIGFSIALAGAVANSDFLVDFVVWGVVAIIAQSFAFGLLRFTFMPKIADRIDKNEVSAGTILAAFSISVGLLNAACMSY
ncbi:MAG: putative membrane protein [Paraglaciecola sp.]|jgi:putative membrane protein|tara:strand:- start:1677 stop:2093 length:417 start_codon:yes stop_codon:yes gene_type:complete